MSDERKLIEPLSAGKYDTDQPREKPPLERPTPPFQVVRNLKLGISDIECIVITHDFLYDPGFSTELSRYSDSNRWDG